MVNNPMICGFGICCVLTGVMIHGTHFGEGSNLNFPIKMGEILAGFPGCFLVHSLGWDFVKNEPCENLWVWNLSNLINWGI